MEIIIKKLLLLLLFFLIACSSTLRLAIQCEKEFHIVTNCNSLKISGGALNSHYFTITLFINGSFTINWEDLLVVNTKHQKVSINVVKFAKNGRWENLKEISNSTKISITTEDKDLYTFSFFNSGETEFFIMPSNFIICDDKPIITEPIRVQLFNWR